MVTHALEQLLVSVCAASSRELQRRGDVQLHSLLIVSLYYSYVELEKEEIRKHRMYSVYWVASPVLNVPSDSCDE